MAPFRDYPFRALREGIRTYYRAHLPLTAEVRKRAEVNPGNGCVIIGWNRLVGELAAHPVSLLGEDDPAAKPSNGEGRSARAQPSAYDCNICTDCLRQ